MFLKLSLWVPLVLTSLFLKRQRPSILSLLIYFLFPRFNLSWSCPTPPIEFSLSYTIRDYSLKCALFNFYDFLSQFSLKNFVQSKFRIVWIQILFSCTILNIPKWLDTLWKSCIICCKIVKTCRTISGFYALKD